jgi:hypothetical protein
MMSNYLQLVCITLAGTSLAATVAVEARSVLMIAAEEKCMIVYINMRTMVSKWLRWKYEVFVSGRAERVYHPGVA